MREGRMYKSRQIFIIILVLVCCIININYMNIVSSPTINNNTRLYIPQIIAKSSSTSHRRAHIVLVENRDLATQKSYGYYTFAMWKLYTNFICQNCNLLVYNFSHLCEIIGSNKENDKAEQQSCIGYNGTKMSPYWMKVQAVRNVMDKADEDDLIIFMDTDNQILNANFTLNLFDLDEVRTFLSSNKQMFVVASYWTYWDKVLLQNQPNGGYRIPIVSNLFMVKNNKVGREMMNMWWRSMEATTLWEQITNESMLIHWPWEQERLAAFYNSTPHLFHVHEESKQYFNWLYHGPLCCIRFTQKHDIIRSLNETLMNQTRTVPKLMSIYNSTTYEELVYDLYHQIKVNRLSSVDQQTNLSQSHELEDFWKIWEH